MSSAELAIDNLEFSKPTAADKEQWQLVYAAYANDGDDYNWDDSKADTIWSWLHDPNHVLECLVAKVDTKKIIGFVHFRATPHPGHACSYGYIDDLYVLPDYRKKGIATRFIQEVADIGRQHDWKFLRWLTHGDNAEARSLYDRIAKHKDRIVYELKI